MRGLVTIVHLLAALVAGTVPLRGGENDAGTRRLLYVAVPGIRNYLEHGGHGLLVFATDEGHRFVRRIPTGGLDEARKPLNVKGICASAATSRIHISTLKTLQCLDLATDKLLWERSYEGGCDRMAIAPDGKTIYLPSLEQDHWHVVDALSGDVLARIVPRSGAHNTVFGPDGREVYLAGLKSPLLTVADAAAMKAARTVGPFSAPVRPFTVNGSQTLCFVNINELLGFEVGDLKAGAAPGRGGGIQKRAHQAARLSESRHRADAGREGAVDFRRRQPARSHLRRHRDAA
jgi:hypothetical protein